MNYPAQSNLWRLDTAIRPQTNGKTFVANGKSQILATASQVFPFVLFPDHIIVEELRIIWHKRIGPWADEIIPIMASDIASVNCASGLFFGFIHIQSLTGGPEIIVENLHKRDVFKIMNIVEGIAMSAREGLKSEGRMFGQDKRSLLAERRVN